MPSNMYPNPQTICTHDDITPHSLGLCLPFLSVDREQPQVLHCQDYHWVDQVQEGQDFVKSAARKNHGTGYHVPSKMHQGNQDYYEAKKHETMQL